MTVFARKQAPKPTSLRRRKSAVSSGINYEAFWDSYAKAWFARRRDEHHLGDEWKGINAGAAESLEDYKQLITEKFILPYIDAGDHVVELGIGGGKTTGLLLERDIKLTCVDISQSMIDKVKKRYADWHIKFLKTDGMSLSVLKRDSTDVFFSYDTFVHLEAQDIFHYLQQIPSILRGKRLVILHVANCVSERGFQRFIKECPEGYGGGRHAGTFSVMTDELFRKIAEHLNYEVVLQDNISVPRDTVWVLKAQK